MVSSSGLSGVKVSKAGLRDFPLGLLGASESANETHKKCSAVHTNIQHNNSLLTSHQLPVYAVELSLSDFSLATGKVLSVLTVSCCSVAPSATTLERRHREHVYFIELKLNPAICYLLYFILDLHL